MIYSPSSSPETWDNVLVGEPGPVLACSPGWWNRKVSVSRCLFPVVQWEWHRGNKKCLVKLRVCGRVNAVRDGGGRTAEKTNTPQSLLKIVLDQWNIGKRNNSYICHLMQKKSFFDFMLHHNFQLFLQLLVVSQLWDLLWNSVSTYKWVCNMSQLFRVRFMSP